MVQAVHDLMGNLVALVFDLTDLGVGCIVKFSGMDKFREKFRCLDCTVRQLIEIIIKLYFPGQKSESHSVLLVCYLKL